jgi:hypothetical protein
MLRRFEPDLKRLGSRASFYMNKSMCDQLADERSTGAVTRVSVAVVPFRNDMVDLKRRLLEAHIRFFDMGAKPRLTPNGTFKAASQETLPS